MKLLGIVSAGSVMNRLKMWQNSNIWGRHLKNQNDIHDETESRLNSENACCHSVPYLLSSHPTSNKPNIKVYRTIILPAVLYGCETWSLTLREEHGWFFRTVFWGGYLDLRGRKSDNGENCIMMNVIGCILHLILLRWLNQGGWGGQGMWHACWSEEVFVGFCWEARRDYWEDLGVGERITLKWILGW
jgi:hypothetical protein